MLVADVDLYSIESVLNKFPGSLAGEMENLVNETGRLLISSSGKVPGLVQVTPPLGPAKGTEAKRIGERAVSRDISKVYANPGRVWAAIKALGQQNAAQGYWQAIQKKDFLAAQKIVERIRGLPYYMRDMRPFDDGAAHQVRRKKDGRVAGKYPDFVVTDRMALKTYGVKKRKLVGLLAAGWVSDAGKLGQVRGVPAWVKRHSAPFGLVRQIRRAGAYQIEIVNNTPYAGREEQRRADIVLLYRVAALKRQLPFIARRLEERLGQQLRAA